MNRNDSFPAHIRVTDSGEQIVQSVSEHCRRVAGYTGDRMSGPGLYNSGCLAGLIHDMGKYTKEFERYINLAAKGEDVVRGSVNHTFAAVIYLFGLADNAEIPFSEYTEKTVRLLAFVCGAHHGVFDVIDIDGEDGFLHRTAYDRKALSYDDAVSDFNRFCADESEIIGLFVRARDEVREFFERMRNIPGITTDKAKYYFGFLARMLLSALIDADRADTYEFISNTNIEYSEVTEDFWHSQISFCEEKLSRLCRDSVDKNGYITPVNAARAEISAACIAASGKPCGIYRLTLPTGSGKTLASLRFALRHAEAKNKRHIFYIIPLLSIIEQNASVIRDYITEPGLLLEHHSNVIREHVGGINEAPTDYELLTQNWNSPITVTTLVQLLNTLFDKSSASIRRFHSLAGSVLIFDEIQSLPLNMTAIVNDALNYLAYCCDCTVILCSATQPAFESVRPHSLIFNSEPKLVPMRHEWDRVFRRTEINLDFAGTGLDMDELYGLAEKLISEYDSLLVVCNTKAEVKALYTKLKNNDDYLTIHLSASMCPAHRRDTIAEIQNALSAKNKRLICVSSQLIEAGVCLSFGCVIRLLAGIDNIVQTAGRGNRNGEYPGLCPVYVVNLKNEKLRNLPDIVNAKNAALDLINRYKQNPERYDNSIISEAAVRDYYLLLYSGSDVKKQFPYPCRRVPYANLYDMLSANTRFREASHIKGRWLQQAFRTAGEEFRVFEDNTTEVIVPHNKEAEEIIGSLLSERAAYDIEYTSSLIRKAADYTVSLFDYQIKELEKSHGITVKSIGGKDGTATVFLLGKPFYSPETGVDTEG